MNTGNKGTLITKAICFLIFVELTVACDTNRGMMDGTGFATMNSWNWGQILVCIGIGFFLGYLVFKRKK